MSSNDFGDWYRGIPQVTRYWFTGSIALPLLGKIGLVNPLWMILDLNRILYKFEVYHLNS